MGSFVLFIDATSIWVYLMCNECKLDECNRAIYPNVPTYIIRKLKCIIRAINLFDIFRTHITKCNYRISGKLAQLGRRRNGRRAALRRHAHAPGPRDLSYAEIRLTHMSRSSTGARARWSKPSDGEYIAIYKCTHIRSHARAHISSGALSIFSIWSQLSWSAAVFCAICEPRIEPHCCCSAADHRV